MLSDEEKNIIDKLESIKVNVEGKLYNFEAAKILCLINKLQKENEVLKTTINKQSADISNNLLELQQKDKQIDLMAETIRKISIVLANYKGSYDKETINFTSNIKCIKQYFEKITKENKNET